MRISDKAYETLKWIAIYFIPSLTTFIGVVGIALSWEHTAVCTTIVGAVGAFIAGCIGMSKVAYNKEVTEKYEGKEEE